MPDRAARSREYSISELEEATGTSRRTIHYYIARDLLPPADGSGPAARYGEIHVLRLKAITALKELRLQLEGIRRTLDSMPVEELRDLFEDADPHPSKVAYRLQRRMAHQTLLKFQEDGGEDAGENAGENAAPDASRREPPGMPRGIPLSGHVGSVSPEGVPEEAFPASRDAWRTRPVRSSIDDATTWRRMQVTPDLEIHYRPGRDSRFTSKLREVVHLIRTLFGPEEPPPGGPK